MDAGGGIGTLEEDLEEIRVSVLAEALLQEYASEPLVLFDEFDEHLNELFDGGVVEALGEELHNGFLANLQRLLLDLLDQ